MAPSDSLRVLVVDDDALLRELVSARLRAGGYDVIEAGTGEEAAAALAAGADPDVLVTDIAMPGAICGWDLGRRARLINPELPIVYTSSGSPDPARVLANSRFLRKPFHPDDLVSAIEQMTSAQPGSGASAVDAADTLT